MLVQSGEPIGPDELPLELAEHPRYRIVELIGKGGMGNVYRAEHRLMNRPVAIKLINAQLIRNPQAVERFRREVQAAAMLSHPNIVASYDAEQAGDAHFLVMEFVEGTDLSSVVKHRGPMSVSEACECIRQVAVGLQHAHEKGMVHRDIKPHNLMLASGGQVRILDFGLAGFATESAFESSPVAPRQESRTSDSAESEIDAAATEERDSRDRQFCRGATGLLEATVAHLTTMGSVMGTPDYMAPEQAVDAHSADIRADIYSLGCTLHFLLTGKPLFEADSLVAKLKAHASEPPPSLTALRKDVPIEVEKIAARMLAKNPSERFQTPAEVAAAFTPFTRGAERPQRRSGLLIAAAVLFAVLLAATAVVIQVKTDNGELVIEAEDDVAVLIDNSVVKIRDTVSGREFQLKLGAQSLRSGDYQIDVTEMPAGLKFSTTKLHVTRGSHERIVATVTPKANEVKAPPSAEPAKTEISNRFPRDQQAAEWVLRLGGKVLISSNGVERYVPKPADLPGGDWQVLTVDLFPLQFDSSFKLDKLSGLRSLRWLRLFNTQVSDAALQDLKDLPSLRYLDLNYNRTTTAVGLKHIGQHLSLLEVLAVHGATISDGDLAYLAPLTKLRQLNLSATNVKGAGLAQLAPLSLLNELYFNSTPITDENLKYLAQFPALAILGLRQTAVTDEGLTHLTSLAQLKTLDLRESRIRSAGLEKLRQALPKATIEAFTTEQEKDRWKHQVESVAWSPLEATTLTADAGETLRRLEDSSVLVEGHNPAQARYTLVTKTSLKHVTALRLDVLRDDELPNRGPGRHENGSFVLTGADIRFQPAAGAPSKLISVRRAFADYTQNSHDASQFAIPGRGSWAIWRDDAPMQNQTLVLDLAEPLTIGEGSTISITLRHESIWHGANLGRFRLSATDADRPPADNSKIAAPELTPPPVTPFRDELAVTAYLNDPRNNRGGSVPVALLGREGRVAFRFGTWLIVFDGIACDPKATIRGFSSFNVPLKGSSGEGTIDFGAGDKLPGVLIKFKFADEQNEISINNNRFKLRGKATKLEFDDKAYDATNSLQTILVARDGSTKLDAAPNTKLDQPQISVPVGQNLINDPSLEDSPQKQLPPGWSPWFNEGPKSQWEIADPGHTGQRSLKLTAVGTRAVIFANSVPLDRSKRYALKGWVKFTSSDKAARAIIKFNYFHNGKWLGVHDLVGVTADQPGWHLLEKTDAAETYSDATQLVPTCHVEGNGTAWFDDLELIAYDRSKLPANFEAVHGKNNRVASLLDFDRWVGEWETERTGIVGRPVEQFSPATQTSRKVLSDRFLLTHTKSQN